MSGWRSAHSLLTLLFGYHPANGRGAAWRLAVLSPQARLLVNVPSSGPSGPARGHCRTRTRRSHRHTHTLPDRAVGAVGSSDTGPMCRVEGRGTVERDATVAITFRRGRWCPTLEMELAVVGVRRFPGGGDVDPDTLVLDGLPPARRGRLGDHLSVGVAFGVPEEAASKDSGADKSHQQDSRGTRSRHQNHDGRCSGRTVTGSARMGHPVLDTSRQAAVGRACCRERISA